MASMEITEAIEEFFSSHMAKTEYKDRLAYKATGKQKILISLNIPPYIINLHDKYYAFEEAYLGAEFAVNVSNDDVEIVPVEIPRLLNRAYKHPFVYPDSPQRRGELAYMKEDWEEKSEVVFGEEMSLKYDGRKTAERILSLLVCGEELLEKKICSESIYSIRYIHSLNCLIAENKEDAVRYASENKIKQERIFDNRCLY
ncbi:TPA: hypothetical protein HA239_00965 [Candidatus Woesearchaeota archaeon]|nr:hypothetical protein QT06_C0001G0232 [archaeon GW2011_AR15]MBS3103968.1 hypothetical protein [Candidatus Woesearchaeota archaeon]HIH40964.1 hypothetical protein [Candidatus Woesearchaeota archaeon]